MLPLSLTLQAGMAAANRARTAMCAAKRVRDEIIDGTPAGTKRRRQGQTTRGTGRRQSAELPDTYLHSGRVELSADFGELDEPRRGREPHAEPVLVAPQPLDDLR